MPLGSAREQRVARPYNRRVHGVSGLLEAIAHVGSGAYLSNCEQYRYALWRIWRPGALLTFVLLNPSTADAELDDPTVTRLMARARLLGYGGIVVVNLFAYRATDPKVMLGVENPVGYHNDDVILAAVSVAGMTICGWGKEGRHLGRDTWVVNRLLKGTSLHILRMGKDGPWHPLYVSYSTHPVEWTP